MTEPFDTEKPPRVVFVAVSGMKEPEVRALFADNPGAARPFREWLASGEAWAAFGDWYDAGNYRRYERVREPGRE